MIKKANLLVNVVLTGILLGVPTAKLSADIIYVDASAITGANDGSSWADAYISLQGALDAAIYGDEIRVAQGTYHPTTEVGGSGDRYKTFQMKNGVGLYGGFPSTDDPVWDDRDPNAYETILSGDIGTQDDNSVNCYHVFYHPSGTGLDATAILDGFTITASNAQGSWPHVNGGGMYNEGSSPIVTGCTFTGNSAEFHGGGMYNKGSNPTVINCTFSGNSADQRYSNHGRGGGMDNEGSSPIVTGCTFIGNSAQYGGGMLSKSSSSPTVTGCTFTGNSAGPFGGGMSNEGSSTPTVTNCTFSGNSTSSNGGGMSNRESSNPTVTNCTFSGNSANEEGGGMYNKFSDTIITNCTFSGNTANGEGGGMYNFRSSRPIVTNCTYVGNSAATGNSIACDSDNQSYPSTLVLTNCILWDGIDEIWNNDGSVITITYSNIQGSWPGLGNIDVDPLFVDPGNWASDGIWVNGNYHLQKESPCIDAGIDMGVYVDIEGIARPWDDPQVDHNGELPEFDIGAYEYHGEIYFVDDDGPVEGDGISWGTAFTNLQEGLDAAVAGDEIWVAAGTYYPSSDYGLGIGDRGKHFRMISGVGIYGGFADTGVAEWADRNPNMYVTILSGDLLGNDYPATDVEDLLDDPYHTDNCYHVFYHPDGLFLDPNAILDGFRITAGNADGSGDNDSGGGMYNEYSSPTMSNCTFTGNSAEFSGGGIYNAVSSPTVTGCVFSGNSARSNGGGMYNYDNSNPIVTGCILWGNTASFGGNEIHNYHAFVNNATSTPVISYCDIAGCLAGGVWDTSLGSDRGGNIDVDPLFVNASGGDFHLQETSPCVDAGNNSAPSLGATDFDGDPRIMNGTVDIGADEVEAEILYSINVAFQPYARAGTVAFDPAGGAYLPGIAVTITVDAAAGYMLDLWSGDLTGNDSQFTIIMDSHKYITAHFVINNNVIYVDADATGTNIGTSWSNAFTNMQIALDYATGEPNQIWVAAGTYYSTSDYGLDIGIRGRHFRMINGVSIYGGFDGTETALAQRNVQANETFFSGDIGVPGEIGDNCYHVFYQPYGLDMDPNAILDGFTITGGNADGGYPNNYGGGMFGNGGTLYNCQFVNNIASGNGGGFYGAGTFINCIFSENKSSKGGGLYSNGILVNCTVHNNYGGGVYVPDELKLVNCIIWDNYGSEIAGSRPRPPRRHGGFPPPIRAILSISYCDIQGGMGEISGSIIYWGPGNIDVDPLFVDPGNWASDGIWVNGNYHLQKESPCIDAGTDVGVYVDIEGVARPWDDPRVDHNGELPEFDIGAYEFVILNTPPVAEAGVDQTVYAEPNGFTKISLDGSGSFDPDGDEITYKWNWTIDGETFTSTGSDGKVNLQDFAELARQWPNKGDLSKLVEFSQTWLSTLGKSNYNRQYDTAPDSPYLTIDLPVGAYVITLIVNDGTEDSQPDQVTITVLRAGDLDQDDDVDLDDLAIVLAARNTPADGPDDPRDLDGDGMITVLDARILVTLFTD